MDSRAERTSHTPEGGRRRARTTPKGRQVEPLALAEIQALLGGAPRRRDLLIEHLHLIQDHYGHISARHLAALAEEMRMAMAEVYEVATFYAHFAVVKEGEAPPPPLTVRVCDSLTCALYGGEELLQELKAELEPGIKVDRAPCVGRCNLAPAAQVGKHYVDFATAAKVHRAVAEGKTAPEIPSYRDYDAYVADGGYALLRRCRAGEVSPEQVIAALDESGLRGLGGAGFPSGRKWKLVRGFPGPRLIAINGDEGEPGTIKDRWYLEVDPHRFLEGTLIGAWAVEAAEAYIYLRDEYPAQHVMLVEEIARLEAEGVSAGVELHLRRGAGAYICGEESAMLESIEGKRGLPRHKPPYPAEIGLFGRPTLIHNIETVFWVRDIVEKGAGWWKSHGRRGRTGLRSFSVSGRVHQPGVKLAPAGITCAELIEEYCGGMSPGHVFKGYLPGGASGGILPAAMANLPLDFGTLEQYGCFIGSAAIIVLSDQDDMRGVALNLLKFFEDESCGQCTPCRVGTEKIVKLMERPAWDEGVMRDIARTMSDASICGLGQAACNPLYSVMKHFRDEVLR